MPRACPELVEGSLDFETWVFTKAWFPRAVFLKVYIGRINYTQPFLKERLHEKDIGNL